MLSNILFETDAMLRAQSRLFINVEITMEMYRKKDRSRFGNTEVVERFVPSDVLHIHNQLAEQMSTRKVRCCAWRTRIAELKVKASHRLYARLKVADRNTRPYDPSALGHTYRSRMPLCRRPFAPLAEATRAAIKAERAGDYAGQRTGKQRLIELAYTCSYAPLVYEVMRNRWPVLCAAFETAQRRFTSGHWKRPVWADNSWTDRHPSHFVHASRETPGNVAFYANTDKLEADKLTSMKPGRYLSAFYGDVLTAEQIKQWANKQWAITRPVELKFVGNDDPLGWVWVYENSQSSCMRYNRSNRYINTNLMGDKHPVTVYAHPENNLALAYMMLPGEVEDRTRNCDTDEYVVGARTIVNTRDKTYLRIYGAGDVQYTVMKEALARAGYAQSGTTLRHETLRLVEVENGYLCPYLDGFDACVSVHSSHLLIGDDGVGARETCGYITDEDEDEDTRRCGHCGEDCDEEAGAYVDSIDEWVCDDCIERDFVRAIGLFGHIEIYRETDNGIVYCDYDECYYVTEYLSENGMGVTDDGYVYPENRLVETEAGVYHMDDAVALTYEFNGYYWVHRNDVYYLPNGETCHVDDADKIAEIEALEQEAA